MSFDEAIESGRREMRSAIRDAAPLALAVCVYGAVFGMLARDANMSFPELLILDAFTFAGAAQFVALGFWSTDAIALAPLAVAMFAVNLRYVAITASLRDVLCQWSWPFRTLAIHFVTDENWALTMARPATQQRADYLLISGLLLWVGWNIGGIAGYYLGQTVPDPKKIGLDFAFTAAFLALALGMWRGVSEDLLPWVVAAVAACFSARFLPAGWHAVVGTAAGIIAFLSQQHRKSR